MRFSEKLRQLRKDNQLSQMALAKAVGLTDRGIRKFESGEQVPSMTVLIILADYFRCTLDDLACRQIPPAEASPAPDEQAAPAVQEP